MSSTFLDDDFVAFVAGNLVWCVSLGHLEQEELTTLEAIDSVDSMIELPIEAGDVGTDVDFGNGVGIDDTPIL